MKKNKKKHHRSKASKKRRAACEAKPELKARHKAKNKAKTQPRILIGDIHNENMPTIDERPTLFPARNLGAGDNPGWMALILARYLTSLERRLLSGEGVEPYSLVSFSFSYLSMTELAQKQELIGVGRFCFPVIEVLAETDISQFCLEAEQGVRNFIAQFNENDDQTIQTVILEAQGSDHMVDVEDPSVLEEAGARIAESYRNEIELSKGAE